MKPSRGEAIGGLPCVLLAFALAAACEDSTEPPPQEPGGRLVVSTLTRGGDPDQDGFELTIDDTVSMVLAPADTVEVDVSPGRHVLRLLGVAAHCSVNPRAFLELEVEAGSATPVAFSIGCPAIAARITTTTSGLDLDQDGYHVVMDDVDLGPVSKNDTLLIRSDPGSRAISLAGLTTNCVVQGSDAREVTIVANEIAAVDFAVVCTAASGVVGVIVEASGTDVEGSYVASVNRIWRFTVRLDGPTYMTGVPVGTYPVSLDAPSNCSPADPQSVEVTGGTLVRDTVGVAFAVTCLGDVGTLRITAPTTGPQPEGRYNVFICTVTDFYCPFYGEGVLLDALAPNDTLLVDEALDFGFLLELSNIPGNCAVQGPNPTNKFVVLSPDTLDFEFPVECR
jgi:hypothetical protein